MCEDAGAAPAGEDEEASSEPGQGDNDLKEHMVSILFSRAKLSHMQKQVWISCLLCYFSIILYPHCFYPYYTDYAS